MRAEGSKERSTPHTRNTSFRSSAHRYYTENVLRIVSMVGLYPHVRASTARYAPINVLPHLPPCGHMTGGLGRGSPKNAPLVTGFHPPVIAHARGVNCVTARPPVRETFTNQPEAIGFSAGRVGIYLFCFPQGWGNYNISW